MDFSTLLDLLSDPRCYPHPTGPVEVCQTHISAVFLAGAYAYKIKKPLDLGFLDFSTLERRRHFCLEEVRLNRRLAPRVYLGVVPVTRDGGGLKVAGEGQALEWAVWMERLPQEATLLALLERGEALEGRFEELGRRLAGFHAEAQGGERVAEGGRWEAVARNARENFEQSAAHVGSAVSPRVHRRFRELTERAIEELGPRIEARARRGVPRDTHGDLHLDHVYAFPERTPPDDLVVVDCIEFNERFRYADPVADVAFLTMDLAFRGRRDLAVRFREAYVRAAEDEDGRPLWPFYEAYRAAVRAKVEGLEATEGEVPEAERQRALASARGHWLLGLGFLEEAGRRPVLLCVGGLPGTGKSTLARALVRETGFTLVATDVVRKELAGLSPGSPAGAPFGEGIYSPDWDARTYGECRRRAEESLFRGERVVVDGSFRRDSHRKEFLAAARRWGVPFLFLRCEADPEAVRARLAERRGDASDADWGIYLKAAAAWEAEVLEVAASTRRVVSGPDPGSALAQALRFLAQNGLA